MWFTFNQLKEKRTAMYFSCGLSSAKISVISNEKHQYRPWI